MFVTTVLKKNPSRIYDYFHTRVFHLHNPSSPMKPEFVSAMFLNIPDLHGVSNLTRPILVFRSVYISV